MTTDATPLKYLDKITTHGDKKSTPDENCKNIMRLKRKTTARFVLIFNLSKR